MEPWELPAAAYHYELPPSRIALFPLEARDNSKLLISDGDKIREVTFQELPHCLPSNTLLVINDTRVVYARLLFRKPTGSQIEVFCLEPVSPINDISQAFAARSGVVWKCFIGNARRWKSGDLEIRLGEISLKASQVSWIGQEALIRLEWTPETLPFSHILEHMGQVPLPPYIHRDPVAEDSIRYQTCYAQHEGSVAAPTAGLHFTDHVMDNLHQRGIQFASVTLHVGAGTFRPVVTESIGEHVMHREQIIVHQASISKLVHHKGPIVAVGTTSVRVLESLYWFGASLITNPDTGFEVGQWVPYLPAHDKPSTQEALQEVWSYMQRNQLETLRGSTQLIIVPGYSYKVIQGMITNFHQPGSTLLMLVAALLGDHWKEVYDYALSHNFRFLSYGDACLFMPSLPSAT